jgi:nitrogen-specific signal transduction histidine kinase/CheY-like chemotaxis protein
MRDFTDQVRAEEEHRKLEERVQQGQKLESLGMLAAGVAHDFNNLLTPILGDASLALMDLPADSPVRQRIERIQRAAHQAAGLTNQLLDYAGIGALDTEAVDLSKLVKETGELLRSAVSRRSVLVYDLAPDLPAVRGDPRLLSQVFVNLLTNASEAVEGASEGGRRIVVRTGGVQLDQRRLSKLVLGEDLPEGPYAYFEVHDEGAGMDPETRARIFDPFFTTKFTGRGLGLAAVLGIVRKHRGAIEIETEPDRGTRVRVLCPEGGDAPPARIGPRDPAGWEPSGTVLVADDDEDVREVISETLSRVGFQVIRAGDGREAVEAFRAHADRIRLVLLDRTMPGTSGEEALDQIRRIRPDVPVVLVSGYSRESALAQVAEQPGCSVLQKPFVPDALLDEVRKLLGG